MPFLYVLLPYVLRVSSRGLGFDHHGGSITQYFRRSSPGSADFGGVVAEADDGVGADGAGVVDQEVVGLLAGLLAHLGVGADLPADDRFEPAEDALGDRRRAD